MATRNQVLKCRKCGAMGTFEYERVDAALGDQVRFISLSSGFTYREDAKTKTHRITCKCGEVVDAALR